MKLTEAICNGASAKAKPYKLFDGEGLYLEIMPNESKLWRLKYRFEGREKRLALGVYPHVKLAEARNDKRLARKQLKAGLDPSQLRKNARKEQPKPEMCRNAFNLSFDDSGILTIETESSIIHLTAGQTEALRTFLDATCAAHGEPHHETD